MNMNGVHTKHIRITDKYILRAEENTISYLLSLDPEKFLYEIYKVAGLTPLTKEGYDGWERSHAINFRGHFFGHYISALSMASHLVSDTVKQEELIKKIKIAVDGLTQAQRRYGELYPGSAGYVSAFREVALDMVEGKEVPSNEAENVIVPWYNLHKILAGLLDAHIYLIDLDEETSKKALSTASLFGIYIYNRITALSDKGKMLRIEYGGINDALYRLFEVTGDKRHRIAASYFDEVELFKELASGNNVLPGRHANTTIPKLIGASRRYLALKNREELTKQKIEELDVYKDAAINFWDIVIKHHTYATGGNSQSEHFHNPDELCHDAEERIGDCTCETCNTHNMLKLSKNLYEITKEIKYLHYYERTYINAILASQNPKTGMMMYFQPMGAGYNKVYNRPDDEFWCCTGTGIENFVKLGDTYYFVEGNSVYINMYISNELSLWEFNRKIELNHNRKTGSLTITAKPLDDKKEVKPIRLALRKPEWAKEISISKKDKAVAGEEVNGFILLEEETGEAFTVNVQFTMELSYVPANDNKDYIALTYGPYVLAGDLGKTAMWEDKPNGILVRVGTKDENLTTTLTTALTTKEWKEKLKENFDWVEQEEYLFALKVKEIEEDILFAPYYEIHESRYGIYFNLQEKGSNVEQERKLKKEERQREKDKMYDELNNFDDNNSEYGRGLKQENSEVGTRWSRRYRKALPFGWFSYEIPVNKDAASLTISLTFHSEDIGKTIELIVNDSLKEQIIVGKEENKEFFVVNIPVNETVLDHKDILKIRFQVGEEESARLFGIKVLK